MARGFLEKEANTEMESNNPTAGENTNLQYGVRTADFSHIVNKSQLFGFLYFLASEEIPL